MDQQTQNRPDFNFILNQPGPDNAKRAKRSPLVFGIAVILILAIVGLAVMVLFVPAKGVTDVASTDTKQADSAVSGDATDAYFEALRKDDPDTAYNQLSDEVKQTNTKSEFLERTTIVYANIKLDSCQKTAETGNLEKGNRTAVYECSTIKGLTDAKITLSLVDQSGDARIGSIKISSKEKA